MSAKKYDVLSVGELLIDFISISYADTMEEVSEFKRFMGGSPANLACNIGWQGKKAVLVSSVGKDALGQYILNKLSNYPIDINHIAQVNQPTTLILVTKSKAAADFEPYRGADAVIQKTQLTDELLKEIKIFHTTCFGLSLNPAQTNIVEAAKKAHQFGAQLSIDVNYAPKIWPNREEAQNIIAAFCKMGALIKVSEVDWERIYETPLTDYKKAADHFLQLGASQVCVTLGEEGSYAKSQNGAEAFLGVEKLEVKDTTGAGDAFWSGYLNAWLEGQTVKGCLENGRKIASIKLQKVGQIDSFIE